jgi:hypothetical protein
VLQIRGTAHVETVSGVVPEYAMRRRAHARRVPPYGFFFVARRRTVVGGHGWTGCVIECVSGVTALCLFVPPVAPARRPAHCSAAARSRASVASSSVNQCGRPPDGRGPPAPARLLAPSSESPQA